MNVLSRLLFVTSLSVFTLASAEPSDQFQTLKANSDALGYLGSFLEKYVGNCVRDAFEGADCRKRTDIFRRQAQGKKFVATISEDELQVSVGRGNETELDLLVTPFFASSGLALSQGAPSRVDSNGHPLFSLIPVKVKVPDGMTASSIARLASTRSVRLEIIFIPTGVWELPQKEGGKMKGVKARLLALSLSGGRSGTRLGEWYASK